MNDFSSRLRQFLMKLSAAFRSFMSGRYGTDRLNMVILCTGLVLSLLCSAFRGTMLSLVCLVLSYALMILAIFRIFSRNTYRRFEENRRFLQLIDRFKDRQNRYFCCPKCRQTVRVPRGKGKIAITCPRCREKFIKKT